MEEYFKVIRQSLQLDRKKVVGEYYEAHHIIPRSFKKKSSTVLLTPEEHYRAHKLLAEYWKNHPVYGKKMLWAFHRISYDGKHQLTEEEYGEVRRLLMKLWTRKQTKEHSEKIAKTRRGKKTLMHPETGKFKYVDESEVQKYLDKGWKNTNRRKGATLTKEHKEKISKSTTSRLTGKTGKDAQASKGPYTVEYETGEKVTRFSYPELAKETGIPYSTLQFRLNKAPGIFRKGWTIYKQK